MSKVEQNVIDAIDSGNVTKANQAIKAFQKTKGATDKKLNDYFSQIKEMDSNESEEEYPAIVEEVVDVSFESKLESLIAQGDYNGAIALAKAEGSKEDVKSVQAIIDAKVEGDKYAKIDEFTTLANDFYNKGAVTKATSYYNQILSVDPKSEVAKQGLINCENYGKMETRGAKKGDRTMEELLNLVKQAVVYARELSTQEGGSTVGRRSNKLGKRLYALIKKQ